MRFASATDMAIKLAIRANKIRVEECESRFGGTFWAICDNAGTIEVHNTEKEAQDRINNLS